MDYTITPADDGPYIIIKTKGEISGQNVMQQNIEAHELGARLGINCYLVDLTEARNTDTDFGNYEFAYNDMQATPGIDRTARVALVVSADDSSHDFPVTVARNAGLNVTLFTDAARAIQHLLGVTPDSS